MSKDKSETSAEDFFPERKSIKAFREAAADCRACDLRKRGTTRHLEKRRFIGDLKKVAHVLAKS